MLKGQWEGEESAPRVGFGETFLVSFEMSDSGFWGFDRFTTEEVFEKENGGKTWRLVS